MRGINISKNKRPIVTVVSTAIIFLGYYLAVYQSFGYQSNNGNFGRAIMILSMFSCAFLWVGVDYSKKWQVIRFVLVIVAILISVIILTLLQRDKYLESELMENGETISATIIGFETEEGRKNLKTNYVTISYEYRAMRYRQRFIKHHDNFEMGQNLEITISKRNPEMFKLSESE
jgi:uncharacterized membrane protein